MFLTAQPHVRVRFRRAIERRALWMAEDAARELPSSAQRSYRFTLAMPASL